MSFDNTDNTVTETLPTPLEVGAQRAELTQQAAAPLTQTTQLSFDDIKQREEDSQAMLENTTFMERRAADMAQSGLGGIARWMYHQSIQADPEYQPSDKFDAAWDKWGANNIEHLMAAESEDEYQAREGDLIVRKYHAQAMEAAGFGEKTASFMSTLVPDLVIGMGAPVAAGRIARSAGASAKGILAANTATTIVEGAVSGAGYVYGDENAGVGTALTFMMTNTVLAMGVQKLGMNSIKKADVFEQATKVAHKEMDAAVEVAKANKSAGKAQVVSDDLKGFGYDKANLGTATGSDDWVQNISASPELVKQLHKNAAVYAKLGWGEHAKLMRSDSEAGRMFAATLLDDGATGARQNMTATGYNQMYMMKLENKFQGFDGAWRDFRIAKGHTRIPGTKLFLNPKSGKDSMIEFEQGVWDVLAHWDGSGTRSAIEGVDKNILKAANAHADTMEIAPSILRNGDEANDAQRVLGSEGLKVNAGYMPLKWNNDAIQAMGIDKAKRIISQGYVNRGMDDELAEEIAGAVIKRQSDKAAGLGGTNADYDSAMEIANDVINGGSKELTMDAAEAITAALQKHGNGRQGYLRSRVDIDLTVPGMKDLVDTNIIKNMRSYMGDVSGSAALARKGIRSKDELENMLTSTARDIAQKDGRDFGKVKQDLDDIIAGFMSRPVKDALGATGRRMQQGTNLAVLGQLGFMQAAETANIASHAFAINAMKSDAFKDTYRAIKDTFIGTRASGRTALLKEFEEATGVTIGIEDKVLRHAVNLDDKLGTRASKWAANLDYGLNSGNHLQGYLSGYNFFRGKQQTMAVDMFLNNMSRISKNGTYDKAAAQLSSAGIDEKLWKRFDSALKKHAKEVDGKIQMNFSRWEAGLVDNLLVSAMRNMDQVIQTSRNGETPLLLSRGAGNFLSTLLKFPILAMEKQMFRNVAEGGTQQAVMAIGMGMLYNSALYTAKAAMTSADDEAFERKMDPVTMLHGSLMMTPAAGIMSNAISIASGFMGGELYGSNYSSGGGLMSLSPMLSFADRTISGVAKAAQGDAVNRQLVSALPFANVMGVIQMKNSIE